MQKCKIPTSRPSQHASQIKKTEHCTFSVKHFFLAAGSKQNLLLFGFAH